MPHRNEYIITDAISGLKSLGDQTVDCIVVDPAYESLEKWRKMGTTTRLKNSKASSNLWFPVVPNSYFDEFFTQCYRVLAKNAHIYVLCDDETSYHVRPYIEAGGFKYRHKVIWAKVGKEEHVNCPNCGTEVKVQNRPGAPGMGYPYRHCYETVIVAEKGKMGAPDDKSVRDIIKAYYPGDPAWAAMCDDDRFQVYEDLIENLPDYIEAERLKGKNYYPTEKPISLLETFIRQSTKEGGLVLDPFAGSGSTLKAAHNLGRDYLGFDVQEVAKMWFEATRDGGPPPTFTEDGEIAPPEETMLDLLSQ